MTDETAPQFGGSLLRAEPAAAGAAIATSCPVCGAHFSRDGRFCPFDRSPLVPARGWDASAAALLGKTVDGRYEVVSVIGEGGMGVVYEVRHAALGKRFALKALRKDLAQDSELAARFMQEARTAAAVSHPGLVEITDFGRIGALQVYFVMELLEGQSLAKLLRTGGPLPAARGLAIVRQLGQALKAAHDAGIVHRDLKPDNIHVGRGDGEAERVKIVDFGLAKIIGSSRVTRAGMVFGTPHYMSPEQAAGEPVDHRADIYALGVVMYEMFTGKVPFEADSYMGVLTKHMYMTPAPPSTLSPELKSLGALEAVILRALQKRPEARYENVAALLADLEQRLPGAPRREVARGAVTSLLADQLELPSATERARPEPSDPWRTLAIVLSLVALIALVMAFSGWTAWRVERKRVEPEGATATRGPAPARDLANPPSPSAPTAGQGTMPSSAANSRSAAPTPLVPARKPTSSSAKKAARSAPKASGTQVKMPLSSDDIVDPWAR